MLQPTNQASNQTTYQQQYDHLMQHLTIDGQAPDPATVKRILRAKPKPAPRGDVPTRAFSLLR
jgi:hypothetical protein